MSNEKQLQNQIQNIHSQIYKTTNKNMLPVLQLYKKCMKDLQGELGKIYSKYSTDGKLDVTTTQEYSILKQMENTLKGYGQDLAKKDEKTVTEILGNNFKVGYFKTAQVIQKGVKTVMDFKLVRPEMVESAVKTPMNGSMYSSRIWTNKTKMINALRDNLKEGMEQGYDIKKLAQNISDTMGSSAYDSMRLANTETARVVNNAQQKIYSDSEVVKKVMWSATLEGNTCEECAALDGQYFDLDDDSKPDIPLHPNCSCCYIPVVDGWQPTERYNQEEGSIMQYKTYDEWAEDKD